MRPASSSAVCLHQLAFFLTTFIFPVALALTCYETDPEGQTSIVQNDEWAYCALVPATKIGTDQTNGSQFGLSPENDMVSMYNSAYASGEAEEYRILTLCLYERYNFGGLLPMLKGAEAVEFTFRCVCNYDLCNSARNFGAFLGNLRAESKNAQRQK